MDAVVVNSVCKTVRSKPGMKTSRAKVFCVISGAGIRYGVIRKINPLSMGKHLFMCPQTSAGPDFMMRQLELNLTTHDHWAMESATASLIVGLRRYKIVDSVLFTDLFHRVPHLHSSEPLSCTSGGAKTHAKASEHPSVPSNPLHIRPDTPRSSRLQRRSRRAQYRPFLCRICHRLSDVSQRLLLPSFQLAGPHILSVSGSNFTPLTLSCGHVSNR